MKNKFLVILAILVSFLFYSCQENKIVITGSVEGSDTLILAISDFLVQDTPDTIVVENGKFSHTLLLDHPTYFYLMVGEKVKMIFLAPGYTLDIAIHSTDSITDFTFSGKGNVENNTLQQITQELDQFDYNNMEKIPFIRIPHYVDSLFNAFTQNFNTSIKRKKIDPIYVNFQRKYFEFNGAMLKTYFGLKNQVEDPLYFKFIDNLEMNNCQYLGIPVFRWFQDYYIEYQVEKKLASMDSTQKNNPEVRLKSKFEVISQYQNEKIEEYLIFSSLKQVIEYEGVEGFDLVRSYYEDFVKQDKFRKCIQEQLQKKLLIAKGKPAFNFTCLDLNGKEVRLQDLKGKVLFIDFWATWCKPCIEENPYFIALSNEYKEKGIQFISISLDDEKNLDEWKKAIKNTRYITHLRTQDGWSKELTDAFQIKGIPTYIIIDQNGNIVDATAPRPSSHEIRPLLDQLIKK